VKLPAETPISIISHPYPTFSTSVSDHLSFLYFSTLGGLEGQQEL